MAYFFLTENFAKRLSVLTQLAAQHPALRDSYLTKSQVAAQKFDVITDAAQVQRHLDELQVILDDVETQLKTIKQGLFSISCNVFGLLSGF